jgi:DNA (cytosine-5)-methyltransferase 1
MSRPRLLDLFCGAGGAAMGYHRAGFDVVGVDNRPQPRFPFTFIQADALAFLAAANLASIAAIHASPPCQAFSRMTHALGDSSTHPDLLSPTRGLLEARGMPWVIENVPGAPMRVDLRLCGCMFLLDVRRERWFETSWRGFDLRQPCLHPQPVIGVYGYSGKRGGSGLLSGRLRTWSRAMGISWMTSPELAQAIPPAYTEYVGAQLLDHLRFGS